MLFARDDDADATVMTLEKINSGEAGKSYRYRLDIVQQMTDEGSLTDVARVVWEGDSATSVGDLINHETDKSKQGTLANELLEHLRSFEGRAVRAEDLVKLFAIDPVKPNTVRVNLKRMVMRGIIESPAHGLYQAVMPKTEPQSDSLARVGVSQVSQVSHSAPNVTEVTGVTPPHVRASAEGRDPLICTGCGHPLPAALVRDGEVRHPTC
jgi:hypothetical protein